MAPESEPISLTARVTNERREEECPLCLEQLGEIWKRQRSCTFYNCCGNSFHLKCQAEYQKKAGNSKASTKCPLCRTKAPRSKNEALARLLSKAKEGKPWAQDALGACYLNGEHVTADPIEAVRWYRKAAEQGWFEAALMLSNLYGMGKVVERSEELSDHFARQCAESNDAGALFQLCMNDFGVVSMDSPRSTWLDKDNGAMTLLHSSAEKGYPLAQYQLGRAYHLGAGVNKSLKDALIWLLRAADGYDGYPGETSASISAADIFQEMKGKRGIPSAVYWLRKAVAHHDDFDREKVDVDDAKKLLMNLENTAKSCCAKCNKQQVETESEKRCVRCKAAYYCSRDCQVSHWKGGHKNDCIPKDIDMLSSEDRVRSFT